MKIGCVCGNVLRDHREEIPFKAWFIPDQDINDLTVAAGEEIEESGDRAAAESVVFSEVLRYARHIYQCRNCGRIFVDDPEGSDRMQVFRPESEDWKKVLASSEGEQAKPWLTDLVAYWDPARSKGEVWFDPLPAEKGGYETFDDLASLNARYYRLLESRRESGRLKSACFRVGPEGGPFTEVHSWSRPSGQD